MYMVQPGFELPIFYLGPSKWWNSGGVQLTPTPSSVLRSTTAASYSRSSLSLDLESSFNYAQIKNYSLIAPPLTRTGSAFSGVVHQWHRLCNSCDSGHLKGEVCTWQDTLHGLYKEAEPRILFLRAPEQTHHGQLYFGINTVQSCVVGVESREAPPFLEAFLHSLSREMCQAHLSQLWRQPPFPSVGRNISSNDLNPRCYCYFISAFSADRVETTCIFRDIQIGSHADICTGAHKHMPCH